MWLIGAIQRRQGKWAESTANLEKAASLNPKDTLAAAKSRYQLCRCCEISTPLTKPIDRALELNPHGIWTVGDQDPRCHRRER